MSEPRAHTLVLNALVLNALVLNALVLNTLVLNTLVLNAKAEPLHNSLTCSVPLRGQATVMLGLGSWRLAVLY